jgi:outer membrane protein
MIGRAGVLVVAAGVLQFGIAGCATSVPRVGGEPIAPVTPSREWRPPAAARKDDSVHAAAPPSLPAPNTTVTLPEIVNLALRNNPVTRESWAQAQAYADAYGAARSSYFPDITGAATVTRSMQPGGSTTLGSTDASSQARSTLSPSVSLSYTVLDFGVRGGTVASARETAYAMSFTHNATIQATVLGVEQAYYSYVAARAVLEAQQASLQEAQVSYDAARKLDSVGMATKADVLLAQTAVAQAQLALDTTQAQVHTTHTTLAVAFGAPATAQFDVDAHATDIDVAEVTQSVDTLVNDAMLRRPDLQAARSTERAAQADVRAARGALFPLIAVSATRGYTDASVSTFTGNNYVLSVGVQVPLFDGFLRRFDVRRAQDEVQYQSAYSAALRQSVAADVVTNYYQVQSAVQQVRTTEALFTSASAAMDVSRARYRAGVGTITDLLAAQAALSSARAQQARSRWVWAQQLAGLAYAAGSIDERGGAGIRTDSSSTPPR